MSTKWPNFLIEKELHSAYCTVLGELTNVALATSNINGMVLATRSPLPAGMEVVFSLPTVITNCYRVYQWREKGDTSIFDMFNIV